MISLFLISIASVIISQIKSENASIVRLNDTSSSQVIRTKSAIPPAEPCPKNMIYYSIDEKSTQWICDCSLSYLYFSEDDSCYIPYRRGPCPAEHYLVLPPGKLLAKCEKNPCLEDNIVFFNGRCIRLYEKGTCGYSTSYVAVNMNTFELMCIFTRTLNIIKAPAKVCPPGSRRTAAGICKRVL